MSPIATESNGHDIPSSKSHVQKMHSEMYAGPQMLKVDFEQFFGIKPSKVDRQFTLSLAEQTYLPKVDNSRADWAVIAAFNSFQAYQRGDLGRVRRFATIGTGSGTDMIAALETFPDLDGAAMTDLHQDVVDNAKRNVLAATRNASKRERSVAEQMYSSAGDLLAPLRGQDPFDLIYENLPNIPLTATGSLKDGQFSSTFIGDRSADRVPSHVSEALLDLHYVCLKDAKETGLIKPSGAILSSMGGRVPYRTMLDMAKAAGYVGRVVSLTWKTQSEPETVIGEYAENQKKGLGKFYFYPTSALAKIFGEFGPAAAALRVEQIEKNLLYHRLDAEAALAQHHAGVEIGHTVYVMASVLQGSG